MKKHYLIGLLALIFSGLAFSQSDNVQNNPELEITLEGKRLEATLICLDALEAPTEYNEFANQFISLPNFPQKSSTLSSQQLKENINDYFINHPELVDIVRSERKKAHDILYGTRPY